MAAQQGACFLHFVYLYRLILQQAVSEIRSALTSIALQINSAGNAVYQNLGRLLSEKQLEEGCGSGIVKQQSVDIKVEFPDMGISTATCGI